ncbi:MAG: FecR family protein [Chitinophagaceae bacterium]|nr:FecR family protein [Chitinophagaceae bacterium]
MSKTRESLQARQEKISYLKGLIWRHSRKEPMTEIQLADVQAWGELSPGHAAFLEDFGDPKWLMEEMREMYQLDQKKAWNTLVTKIRANDARIISFRTKLRRIGYAAVISIPLTWMGLQYFASPERLSSAAQRALVKEPGNFSALLTVNDGRHIVLERLGDDQVSSAGDMQATMKGTDTLLYTLPARGSGKEIHHTVQTGRKQAFHLVFPDESNVTLSYASRLNYVFTSEGRVPEMSLSGHAFFNITPNATQPFALKVNDTRIEVLGTSFDVMAYPDDSVMQVTLRSGKIRVWKGLQHLTLDTVRQVRVTRDSMTLCKDPEFLFKDADLATVLGTIARWYNVEISNPQHVRGIHVTGGFPLALSLDDVLRKLEKMQSGHARFHNMGNNIEIIPGK